MSDPRLLASYAYARRIVREAASNFYYAFFLLPRSKRDAICSLYAFMRRVDDVSDSAATLTIKQQGIAAWRSRLDAAVTGDVSLDGLLPALRDTLQRFSIPPRYLHDLISGAEMDLTVSTYPTFERLREYCYRVAGTVGITCLHIFGSRSPHAHDLAEKLGIAFQLTNIIRDVPRDFAMGRIYLPEEDLASFHCRPQDLASASLTPEMEELLTFEASRAWEFYREGSALLPLVCSDSRPALWALIRIYSGLLTRIEDHGFDVFSSRVSLSKTEKAAVILRARLGWWNNSNALQERTGHRRRAGGPVLRRRAG